MNCAIVETLESRRLLSVAPVLTDGVLSVSGTTGDDKIRISIGKDTSKLAVKVNGTVTLFSLSSITKIKVDGLAGDDTICIKQHHGGIDIASELDGGDGDDKISGGNGNDLISGGAGNDVLRGNSGDDVLSGGSGDDKISGGRGDDSLLGGADNDKLRGGGGSDVLDGGKGKDRLRGGGGMDHFFGNDVILDTNKNEKAHRFAQPIDWVDDGSSETDQGDGNANEPIWWDPEANTDDSGNPVDMPNIY